MVSLVIISFGVLILRALISDLSPLPIHFPFNSSHFHSFPDNSAWLHSNSHVQFIPLHTYNTKEYKDNKNAIIKLSLLTKHGVFKKKKKSTLLSETLRGRKKKRRTELSVNNIIVYSVQNVQRETIIESYWKRKGETG